MPDDNANRALVQGHPLASEIEAPGVAAPAALASAAVGLSAPALSIDAASRTSIGVAAPAELASAAVGLSAPALSMMYDASMKSMTTLHIAVQLGGAAPAKRPVSKKNHLRHPLRRSNRSK
jgi:hypothetical protein